MRVVGRERAHGLEAAQVRAEQQRAAPLLLHRDQVFLAGARDRERAVLAQREEQPVERDVREAKEVRVHGAEAVRLPEAPEVVA